MPPERRAPKQQCRETGGSIGCPPPRSGETQPATKTIGSSVNYLETLRNMTVRGKLIRMTGMMQTTQQQSAEYIRNQDAAYQMTELAPVLSGATERWG